MEAAGATGRAGAGVWGGSLFPLGHVRLGGSGYLRMQIHAPLWGRWPAHGARESKDRYYLRGVPKERAPGDQHRTTLNAHLTAPWPMEFD